MSEKRSKSTRKKVKVVGEEQYINQQTGEMCTMQVVSIEERDANFHKIWLGHILQSIDLIGNQKTRLAFWLLDQMDKMNQITMTQRQIATKAREHFGSMSLGTARDTIAALIEAEFLVRKNMGVYQVNPNMMFKGGQTDRLNVLLSYQNAANENTSNKSDKSDPGLNQPDPNQTTIDDALKASEKSA